MPASFARSPGRADAISHFSGVVCNSFWTFSFNKLEFLRSPKRKGPISTQLLPSFPDRPERRRSRSEDFMTLGRSRHVWSVLLVGVSAVIAMMLLSNFVLAQNDTVNRKSTR